MNTIKQTPRSDARERLVSLGETASRLSLSKRAVYRLIAGNILPAPVKVGGASRLYESDIESFLHELRSTR